MRFLKQNKKGSALAYMLVILTVVMIILVSMRQYITSELKFSFNRVEKEKAFQVAEAGINYYRWYLAHQTAGKTAQQIESFWASETMGVDPNFYQADYLGIGVYELAVTKPVSGSTILTVKSTGWSYKEPDMKRTIQVRFRRPSWSEYAFLSNSFMNFGDEATVYGKVHSNGGIRFDGVAYGEVSSLPARFLDPSHGGFRLDFGVHTHEVPADPYAPSYPWPDGTVPARPDVFKAGRSFPVPEVSFSGVTADLANMKAKAQAGNGRYFDSTGEGRKITLKSNGTYDVCTIASVLNDNSLKIKKYLKNSGSGTCTSCSGDCAPQNYPIVNNGVIFVENDTWVEGTINDKRVTVVAAKLSGGDRASLYIGISDNNIRLAAYDCDNMLGLVAQKNLLVLDDCPEEFIVDAALLAQTGYVGINNNVSSKTSMTFNGAITSYLQPYFQHGTSGFAVRDYYFNNNLLYCPPPYFPTGTEYSIDLWEEL